MRLPLVAILVLAGCGAGAPRTSPGPAIRGPQGQVALERSDGRPTRLAEHGRPVTVIGLWATYCQPCLDELPYLEALHRARPDDVAVLAVNVEDRRDPATRVRIDQIERDSGLTLPRFYAGGALFEALAPRDAGGQAQLLLPLLAVIDPQFRIHRRTGFVAGTSIAAYLAEKAELIAAARRGDPPASVEPTAPLELPPGSRRFTLTLPRMTEAEIAAFAPRFREQVARMFPRLDAATLDELVARATVAAREGTALGVDLDARPAPPAVLESRP